MTGTTPLRFSLDPSSLGPGEVRLLGIAAQDMMNAWSMANARHGSLVQAWVRGRAMIEDQHYPRGDVIDRRTGSQYFYHAHRTQGREHGHLHLFWHATATGRRNANLRVAAPSHLFAIALDAKGLPEALFTTNLWVTGGHWFDASTTLSLVDRFSIERGGRYTAADRWLNHFIALYRTAISLALSQRDRRRNALTRRGSWTQLAKDSKHEVLSIVTLDLAADMKAIEQASA